MRPTPGAKKIYFSARVTYPRPKAIHLKFQTKIPIKWANLGPFF